MEASLAPVGSPASLLADSAQVPPDADSRASGNGPNCIESDRIDPSAVGSGDTGQGTVPPPARRQQTQVVHNLVNYLGLSNEAHHEDSDGSHCNTVKPYGSIDRNAIIDSRVADERLSNRENDSSCDGNDGGDSISRSSVDPYTYSDQEDYLPEETGRPYRATFLPQQQPQTEQGQPANTGSDLSFEDYGLFDSIHTDDHSPLQGEFDNDDDNSSNIIQDVRHDEQTAMRPPGLLALHPGSGGDADDDGDEASDDTSADDLYFPYHDAADKEYEHDRNTIGERPSLLHQYKGQASGQPSSSSESEERKYPTYTAGAAQPRNRVSSRPTRSSAPPKAAPSSHSSAGQPRSRGKTAHRQHKYKHRQSHAQEKLAAAVFDSPQSLRDYALDAFEAARAIQKQQQQERRQQRSRQRQQQDCRQPRRQSGSTETRMPPELELEPRDDANSISYTSPTATAVIERRTHGSLTTTRLRSGTGSGRQSTPEEVRRRKRHLVEELRRRILGTLGHLARIPYILYVEPTTRHLTITISVTVTLVEGSGELLLDSTFAGWTLSTRTAQSVTDAILDTVAAAWDETTGFILSTRPVEMVAGPAHRTACLVSDSIQTVTSNAMSTVSTFLDTHLGSSEGQDESPATVSASLSSLSTMEPSYQSNEEFSLQTGLVAMNSAASLKAGMDSVLSSSVGELSRANEQHLRAQAEMRRLELQRQQEKEQLLQLQQMQQEEERQQKKQKRILRKLSSLNSAASVVAYREIDDDTGGLSNHARSRVKRMMHYEISLRPFVATVKPATNGADQSDAAQMATVRETNRNDVRNKAGEGQDGVIGAVKDANEDDMVNRLSEASFVGNSVTSSPFSTSPMSPFMCTPQSFPATPKSRRIILARGTRFADDVLFLARDQLRVLNGLESDDIRTRGMAQALSHGHRLAVFDADDGANMGIEWTCGQHVATKVANMLYCSTRSMVPILRNCFVYFEMTVLPRPGNVVNASSARPGNQPMLLPHTSMATLSIGLSTKEMPPSTLVGAWRGSVGLCTNGQILTAGQWCSSVDPSQSAYGDRSTVGCLVCLNDSSAIDTWDGIMVTAAVTFWVNGVIVSPPVAVSMAATNTASNVMPAGPGVNTMAVGRGAVPHARPQGAQSAVPVAPSIAAPFQSTSPAFTLPLMVPADEELYPTVTLHSPGSSVMCRFHANDILCPSREFLGVPPGFTVYAVDGSVLFE